MASPPVPRAWCSQIFKLQRTATTTTTTKEGTCVKKIKGERPKQTQATKFCRHSGSRYRTARPRNPLGQNKSRDNMGKYKNKNNRSLDKGGTRRGLKRKRVAYPTPLQSVRKETKSSLSVFRFNRSSETKTRGHVEDTRYEGRSCD